LRTAPAGRAPVFRKRQRARSHGRSTATIPIVRRRALPGPNRACSPWGRGRSGCQRTQPHASARAMGRLAPCPAVVRPRSRQAWPRWEGVGVRPASAPPGGGGGQARQANNARTNPPARFPPLPRRGVRWRSGSRSGALRVRRAARRAAAREGLCAVRHWPWGHARCKRARKAAGRGEPVPWRPGASGGAISPGTARPRPEPARRA
jgi:hypothetical protein